MSVKIKSALSMLVAVMTLKLGVWNKYPYFIQRRTKKIWTS